MAKKRKTLPDNIREIIASGDMEAFRAVFDRCEPGATVRGATTENILSFSGLSPEHIRFIISLGLDLNADCGYGMTAVAYQSDNAENLRRLVEAGADVNRVGKSGESALHRYCRLCKPDAIAALLEHGADTGCISKLRSVTPLDELLACCDNINIADALTASRLLLEAGARPTDRTKKYVHAIGERFEFVRTQFSPDLLQQQSDALDGLYALFDVPPVPRRVMHDGSSPITAKTEGWQKQHNELWNLLVPATGKAATVQGELIRLVGKLLYEILDNGGCNWCEDHRKMLRAMEGYFSMADGADQALTDEAIRLCKAVSPSSNETMLERLNELTVRWVLANPMPIKLGKVDYLR